MNKTVVIGGTFRPITNAHIEMGIQARKRFPDANIIYIPSNLKFISDWKEISKDDVFDKGRINILRESVNNYGFSMSDIEVKGITDGTTYQAVSYLKTLGFENIVWCIGYDKLDELDRWDHADELLKEVEFLVFSRNRKEKNDIQTEFEVIDLDDKFQDISSTRVREAFYNNDFKTIKEMVPYPVYQYLKEQRNE